MVDMAGRAGRVGGEVDGGDTPYGSKYTLLIGKR
jgi:hypothetical protein